MSDLSMPQGAQADEELRAAIRRGWITFRVTTLGVLLTFLNTSSLNVVMPTIVAYFGVGPSVGNWILLGYMLAHAVFLLIFGALGDIVGRKRLYLLGLIGFTVTSLGCALAPTAAVLIFMRVLQAIASAAIITNTTSLLTDAFPPEKLPVGLGFNTTMAAASQVAGPLVGGAAATAFGWQAVFLFNIPFGLLALWFGRQGLQTGAMGEKHPFDWTGSLLFALALSALLFFLSTAGIAGVTAPASLAALTATVVAFPLLARHLKRAAWPLVDLRLFDDRALAAACIAALAAFAAYAGVAVLAALFMRTVQNMSAFSAGFHVMALAAGMMVSAPLVGNYARRRAVKWRIAALGLVLEAVSLVIFGLTLAPGYPEAALLLALFGAGAGYGSFMTPNTASVMLGVDPKQRGIVNGLRSVMLNTGGVLGTTIGLAIVAFMLPADAKSALYGGGLDALPALRENLTDGFRIAFVTLGAGAALASVLMFAVRRVPSPGAD